MENILVIFLDRDNSDWSFKNMELEQLFWSFVCIRIQLLGIGNDSVNYNMSHIM